MLEARIKSPKGSLYFAAEATPYDLELLRLHVRDLTPRNASSAHVVVRVDDRDPAVAAIADWLWQLAGTGVHVARKRAAL